MVELLTTPPPMEAIARMTAIEGVRVAPTMLGTQRGPTATSAPRRPARCSSSKRRSSMRIAPPSSG